VCSEDVEGHRVIFTGGGITGMVDSVPPGV
jgi:hypothetical protein